ncbi:MAG: prepilin-type N-terminal cleavage/methylation domain-containing protein [Pseudomonadota bacterium]
MFILKTAFKARLANVNTKGFTLLEIMVSVAIIALVFVSLLRMQTSVIQLASATRFTIVAPILARQLLSQIDQDLENWSQTQGDFGENYPKIQWTCNIFDAVSEPLEIISKTNQENFKKIEITLTAPSGQTPYTITTWRAILE